MGYISHTERDIKEMLEAVGAGSVADLFADLPESIRLKGLVDLPGPLSEIEVSSLGKSLAAKNRTLTSFLGAGAYHHYIPAAVDHLASRSEFYTAYTPYQPEVSQGTLTAIFEFQSMICRLTGMDVANASMYDGATALAEAVLMSVRSNGKNRALLCDSLHPHYRQVLKTYAWANDIHIVESKSSGGTWDIEKLKAEITGDTGALIAQNPNFFGCLEDVKALADAAHAVKANLIAVVTEPLSLGLLKAPGGLGADIVCGEGQAFGNPVGFGGPLLGLLAAKDEFLRKMPGRLVGRTLDAEGKEAYVLTLQTREQHIRRERATSNICSNEGLCALRAVIYLGLLGNRIRDLARVNHLLAGYLKNGLREKGFKAMFDRPYFNEFIVRCKNAKAITERLRENGFAMGLTLGDQYGGMEDCVLVCCTEMNSPRDIDEFLALLDKVV